MCWRVWICPRRQPGLPLASLVPHAPCPTKRSRQGSPLPRYNCCCWQNKMSDLNFAITMWEIMGVVRLKSLLRQVPPAVHCRLRVCNHKIKLHPNISSQTVLPVEEWLNKNTPNPGMNKTKPNPFRSNSIQVIFPPSLKFVCFRTHSRLIWICTLLFKICMRWSQAVSISRIYIHAWMLWSVSFGVRSSLDAG